MRTNIAIFWMLTVFFALAATLYLIWGFVTWGTTDWTRIEWVGVIAMYLSAALAAFIAYYLGMVYKAQGGDEPQDRLDADIDDGDPEIGTFSPWSWWPISLAGALALVFLGLAVGFWIVFIGLPLVLIALVGWVYEYYRGYFVR